MARQTGVTAFIDRIEEDLAAAGVKEGDHLRINFQLDPESAEATRRRIAETKRDLLTDYDPNQKNFKL
jgi:hypothetical protein